MDQLLLSPGLSTRSYAGTAMISGSIIQEIAQRDVRTHRQASLDMTFSQLYEVMVAEVEVMAVDHTEEINSEGLTEEIATEDNREGSTMEDRKAISQCILSEAKSTTPRSNINKFNYSINRVVSQRQEIKMATFLSLSSPKP